ncbi:MAG: TrbI/VirB10 family protein [Proteobacteria bacterium]|nr:TrbI/VirB10 family protein [Pseudomonadota bacterium]
MSDAGNAGPGQVAPETLELRARPEPVTRVNRKVLIGGAAVGLILILGLVLVALKPPTFRVANPQELVNVEHKPVTDGLAKLPVSYDSLPAEKADRAPKLAAGVPQLTDPSVIDTLNDPQRMEKARLDRMAGQARESQVFFRLQLKSPPSPQAVTPNGARSELDAQPVSTAAAGNSAPNAALRAAERARDLNAGAFQPIGTDATEATRKLAFLRAGSEKDIYNPHALETPASRYQLMAGTIIAASLISGLNSDLPGFVIAQVTENVYDTVSGKYLLIPQGSRLIGKYDNVVAFGQERALVVWQRIILPDGSSVLIDNLPATDTAGYAGLADAVDLHTWTLLKGVALATVLGVGSELAFGTSDSDLVRALQQSTQSTTNQAGQRLVERDLNVQPTITVRPGWPLRVIVHKDIVLRPYLTTAAK